MDKKRRMERLRAQSVHRWKKKIDALNELEATIQALIMEYQEIYGVEIRDVQLYNPKTGSIQFETDL